MKINRSYKRKAGFLTSKCLLTFFTLLICGNQEQLQASTIQLQSNHKSQITWQNMTISQAYQNLNQQIESLNEDYIPNFISTYHTQKSRLIRVVKDESLAGEIDFRNVKNNSGNYLLLLAKMYLYDILPKSDITGSTWGMYQTDSRYLLAYFYMKVAADRYANAEAYYYLALMDYYKLHPHQTFIHNLEKLIDQIALKQGYDQIYKQNYYALIDYLKNQRFTSVQHNLFISSLLGHHGASFVLGNMNKQGLGMDKNCTTALSYYLSIVKDTYVDIYEFRSSYSDQKNFEKQLYAKRKVVFENQQNVDVVSDSQFFDSETIKATYELAENYFIGRGGFKKNYQKAAELYSKLAAQDHKNSMAMLGMCYFKGQGVPIDRKRARVLFDHSNKVSISQAMLIVMDFFEIQSKGNRAYAIKRMKQIYQKKKDFMNPILKYLFAAIIIKGKDVKQIKVDDGVLLMGSAAKQGHLMAKVSMGLLFADGIDVNFDCLRSINYFSQEGLSHPFFIDKFHMARIGLKGEHKSFSLIKYLQLSTIGDTNSFINSLYILEIQKQESLGLNQDSWSLVKASQNILYQRLKKQRIVPDMHSYFQKHYSFQGQKTIKYGTLQKLFQGNTQAIESHFDYIKKKIIKVCAITKENSLMNFYEHKMNKKEDPVLLSTISNGEADKLHVLEARYLLGQYYHRKSFQALKSGKDHSKQQYKALQQYKRATSSPLIGKMLFYLQQIKLSPFGIDFEDELFQFGFLNDLLTYTFILSILVFILYYKRSKKLDQIHRKQLQKREDDIRIRKEQQDFRIKFPQGQVNQDRSNIIPGKQIKYDQKEVLNQKIDLSSKRNDGASTYNENQPEIIEQRLQKIHGHRIGGSEEEDHLVIRQVYEFYQNANQQSNEAENQPNNQEQCSQSSQKESKPQNQGDDQINDLQKQTEPQHSQNQHSSQSENPKKE